MKPSGINENDESLSELLQEWKANPSLPPRFEDRVWRRIAVANAVRPARSGLAEMIGRVQALLARPALAAGYVTALLVLGFAAGWAQGLEKSAKLDQSLGARYVQVIDPYRSLSH